MIDLLPNDEQQELIDAVSAFLRRELTTVRLREIAASGNRYDADLWVLCAKQGWYGLGLAAERGGVGYTVAEEAFLFRELGRHLVPGPAAATVLAAHVAASAGADDVVAALQAGTAVAGLAEVRRGEERALVWDAGLVQLLLVVDPVAGRATVHEVAADALGASDPTIDPLHGMGRVTADRLGDALASAPADGTIVHGAILVAAMLAGVAEALRDMGAQYAKDREQFGKPIGAFQAVKHRAADTAIRAEAAWSQTAVAALRLASGGPGHAFQASAAKVVAADAAIRNARDVIQNLGAIGFTAEHDAHLFLKRAHVLDHMLGDTRAHLAVVLDETTA